MPVYVAIFRPRLVLIENVPNLARHDDGETLRVLIKGLEQPGPRKLQYRVEYGVYDAALYGTPQARRRILILAVRKDSGEERLPEESPDLAPLYTAFSGAAVRYLASCSRMRTGSLTPTTSR